MKPEISYAITFSAIALGQVLICITLLLNRAQYQSIYRPLILFFIAYCISSSLYIFQIIAPQDTFYRHLHIIISAPLDAIFPPLFWLFLRGITSDNAKNWHKVDTIHFIPFALGTILCLILVMLSPEARLQLLDGSGDRGNTLLNTLKWSILTLYIGSVCQCCVYIFAFSQRLVTYRQQLMTLFASPKSVEHSWILGLVATLSLYACYVFVVVAIDLFTSITRPDEPWDSLVDMLLIWMLCAWTMRQKPGLANEMKALNTTVNTSPKYEKSGLTDVMQQRISTELQKAMYTERLFIDPDLSLRALAQHLTVLPNYLTQTLNTQFKQNFFDYVNSYRINEAKKRLSTQNENITDIAYAVGFNSKSAFYSAFKKIANTTPSLYRKSQQIEK